MLKPDDDSNRAPIDIEMAKLMEIVENNKKIYQANL